MTEPDILIAGGGIAGLIATAAFAERGTRVICCDPGVRLSGQRDLRSTALLLPSIKLLQNIGVWADIAPYAAELRVMRLADAGGEAGALRYQADFDARDIGAAQFGWNVPNWRLRERLIAHLESHVHADLKFGRSVARFVSRLNYGVATLDNGAVLRPKLLLAADGRNSTLREGADIAVKRTRFGQKALVFTVRHATPHNGVSTEIHRSGGPFTLVPLPDQDASPASAVVWMETGPKATALAQMDVDQFQDALNLRACNVLGPLELTSARATWPIISQRAERLVEGRLALMAEAAHVVPPIGAQGLNMSLGDIACLLELTQSSHDPGDPSLLDRYERERMAEIKVKLPGIGLLNQAALMGFESWRDMRLSGLRLLFETKTLRELAMTTGLGVSARSTAK